MPKNVGVWCSLESSLRLRGKTKHTVATFQLIPGQNGGHYLRPFGRAIGLIFGVTCDMWAKERGLAMDKLHSISL
jgi:hypothetical protein